MIWVCTTSQRRETGECVVAAVWGQGERNKIWEGHARTPQMLHINAQTSQALGKFFVTSMPSNSLLERAPCCFTQAAICCSPTSNECSERSPKTRWTFSWEEYAASTSLRAGR